MIEKTPRAHTDERQWYPVTSVDSGRDVDRLVIDLPRSFSEVQARPGHTAEDFARTVDWSAFDGV